MKHLDKLLLFTFLGLALICNIMLIKYDKIKERLDVQNKYIKELTKENNEMSVEIDNLNYQFKLCKILYKGL